ncbi:MAG: DMT family transporter [Anaerolineae bacterium]
MTGASPIPSPRPWEPLATAWRNWKPRPSTTPFRRNCTLGEGLRFLGASPQARRLFADLALVLVTAIWGATFVMVKEAVAAFPVFAFLALRFALAWLAILPLWAWMRCRQGSGNATGDRVSQWARGILIGGFLFAGYAFQTAGLQYTTASKAGFITGLSVVMVPFFSAVVLRRPPGQWALAGVGLATVGMFLLSWGGDWHVGLGELLVLGCAFSFAAHITAVGAFAPRGDVLSLTATQIATVGILSVAASATAERAWPAPPASVWGAAAFTGVLATSFAFGVQTAAQRFTSPTHTALIFAAEPVFAAAFGFLLAGETLGPRETVGCALILLGMLTAEAAPLLLRGNRHT